MVEHKFTVGREKKEKIRINHSAMTGKTAIIINGESIPVVNGRELDANHPC